MKRNKRLYPRFNVATTLRLTCPGHGDMLLRTRDQSTGGVFLEKGNQEFLPPPGTTVFLQITELLDGEEAPVVKAEVVRANEEGIGVRFAE